MIITQTSGRAAVTGTADECGQRRIRSRTRKLPILPDRRPRRRGAAGLTAARRAAVNRRTRIRARQPCATVAVSQHIKSGIHEGSDVTRPDGLVVMTFRLHRKGHRFDPGPGYSKGDEGKTRRGVEALPGHRNIGRGSCRSAGADGVGTPVHSSGTRFTLANTDGGPRDPSARP